MQNRRDPSFFRTRTTLLAHGLAVGSIIPCSSISATCLSMVSRCLNGCRRRGCRIGRCSPVSIRYSTSGVRPMSYSPLEKIASFSCRSSLACLRCSSVSSFGRLSIICRITSTFSFGSLVSRRVFFGSITSAGSSFPSLVPFFNIWVRSSVFTTLTPSPENLAGKTLRLLYTRLKFGILRLSVTASKGRALVLWRVTRTCTIVFCFGGRMTSLSA